MKFRTVTAVAADAETVTLAEARLQARVDSDDTTHDAALTALITVAREHAEHYTGRALAPRTLEVALDAFPAHEGDYVDLPMPPVTAITSVKYTDEAGAEQTVDPGDYALSPYGELRRLAPTYGSDWPTSRAQPDAVRIRFECGYGAEGGPVLPLAAKQAMLLHIEMDSPLNSLNAPERQMLERARDALLDTIKIWGR